MSLHISLNGKDIRTYNLVPLQGTIAALIKPAKYKNVVSNTNAAMNGVRVIAAPTSRRVDKQEVTLNFHISAPSLADLSAKTKELESVLVAGKNSTGVNELVVRELNSCFRLVYESIASFSNFGQTGRAVISIKFLEPNPNNRAI